MTAEYRILIAIMIFGPIIILLLYGIYDELYEIRKSIHKSDQEGKEETK